jgi:hypothetical protein
VTLTCGGGMPVGYTCGVSPGTVNLSNSAPAAFLLTLTPPASGASVATRRTAILHPFGKAPAGPTSFVAISFLAGLASLPFFAAPRRSIRWRVAARLIMISSVCLALGCGGGSSGNGGGGALQQATPTTTTVMTNAAKVASQAPFTVTATVTGSQNPTGGVQFYANNLYLGSGSLIGNTASTSASIFSPGIYNLTAQYFGDNLNNPSTSAAVNQAITGTTTMYVQGQTGTTTHSANVNVTIQ